MSDGAPLRRGPAPSPAPAAPSVKLTVIESPLPSAFGVITLGDRREIRSARRSAPAGSDARRRACPSRRRAPGAADRPRERALAPATSELHVQSTRLPVPVPRARPCARAGRATVTVHGSARARAAPGSAPGRRARRRPPARRASAGRSRRRAARSRGSSAYAPRARGTRSGPVSRCPEIARSVDRLAGLELHVAARRVGDGRERIDVRDVEPPGEQLHERVLHAPSAASRSRSCRSARHRPCRC